MQNRIVIFIAITFSTLIPLSSLHATQNGNSKHWSYEFSPYVWAASLQGEIGVQRQAHAAEADFDNLLDNLETGAMFMVAARSPKWSVWADMSYIELEEETTDKHNALKGTIQETLGELSISYKPRPRAATEWYVGGRYVGIDATILLTSQDEITASKRWLDPLLGARSVYRLTPRLSAVGRTDIGGFGAGSNFSWHVMLGGTYQIGKNVAGTLAYRHLNVDYDDDNFNYTMTTSGLAAGLTFKFK